MYSVFSRTINVFSVVILFYACAAHAEVIPVPPSNKGFFASSASTMTFLYPAHDAKATLIFIPGGEGRVGVKPDWTADHKYFSRFYFNVMLGSLADPLPTSGRFNVVIFDSPFDLPISNQWSAARTGNDHLSRVEDVVRYYKEKLGKPVWVMGHSMGSISITELYKRLQKNKNEDLVAGLILSGGENEANFNYETTRLPVLILHNENDGCSGNNPFYARKKYEKLRDAGNTDAELVLIKTGSLTPGQNDPCRSGFHMYYGAGDDVAKVLDQFMSKHLPKL